MTHSLIKFPAFWLLTFTASVVLLLSGEMMLLYLKWFDQETLFREQEAFPFCLKCKYCATLQTLGVLKSCSQVLKETLGVVTAGKDNLSLMVYINI